MLTENASKNVFYSSLKKYLFANEKNPNNNRKAKIAGLTKKKRVQVQVIQTNLFPPLIHSKLTHCSLIFVQRL